MAKVADSHLYGWGSIPGKTAVFFTVSSSKGSSLYFMCSDQHVKYRMVHGFSLTSSLLLDYHVKKYIYIHAYMYILTIDSITINKVNCSYESNNRLSFKYLPSFSPKSVYELTKLKVKTNAKEINNFIDPMTLQVYFNLRNDLISLPSCSSTCLVPSVNSHVNI